MKETKFYLNAPCTLSLFCIVHILHEELMEKEE